MPRDRRNGRYQAPATVPPLARGRTIHEEIEALFEGVAPVGDTPGTNTDQPVAIEPTTTHTTDAVTYSRGTQWSRATWDSIRGSQIEGVIIDDVISEDADPITPPRVSPAQYDPRSMQWRTTEERSEERAARAQASIDEYRRELRNAATQTVRLDQIRPRTTLPRPLASVLDELDPEGNPMPPKKTHLLEHEHEIPTYARHYSQFRQRERPKLVLSPDRATPHAKQSGFGWDRLEAIANSFKE